MREIIDAKFVGCDGHVYVQVLNSIRYQMDLRPKEWKICEAYLVFFYSKVLLFIKESSVSWTDWKEYDQTDWLVIRSYDEAEISSIRILRFLWSVRFLQFLRCIYLYIHILVHIRTYLYIYLYIQYIHAQIVLKQYRSYCPARCIDVALVCMRVSLV